MNRYQSLLVLLLVACNTAPARVEKEGKQKLFPTERDSLKQVVIDSVYAASKKKSGEAVRKFMPFWDRFVTVVKGKDVGAFRKMAVDSVEYKGGEMALDRFMATHYQAVFDDSMVVKMVETSQLDFGVDGVYVEYLPVSVQRVVTKEEANMLYVTVTKSSSYPDFMVATFRFVVVKDGYRFYSYDWIGGK